MYDDNMKQTNARMNYHMLEINRICAAAQLESNFHVFYSLVFGSSNELLEKICLDPSLPYKVTI